MHRRPLDHTRGVLSWCWSTVGIVPVPELRLIIYVGSEEIALITVGCSSCFCINIEIDDCDMRRTIHTPMLTVIATFGWTHTRGQSSIGAKMLDLYIFVRILDSLRTSGDEAILCEGTYGKEVVEHLFCKFICHSYLGTLDPGERWNKREPRHHYSFRDLLQPIDLFCFHRVEISLAQIWWSMIFLLSLSIDLHGIN